MILSPLNWNNAHRPINHFRKTVSRSIFFVSGIIFVVMIVASALMISLKPYYAWPGKVQLPRVLTEFEWPGLAATVTILILVALFGK